MKKILLIIFLFIAGFFGFNSTSLALNSDVSKTLEEVAENRA
jgi:hypothetical protein